jgi:hypothetical protein
VSRFPKLASPVSPAEVFVVPASVHPARAREAVERAVHRGWFRPADAAEAADIDTAELLFVPFWRVSVSVDGFHVGLNTFVGGRGRMIPIPTGGARHRDADVMICGRTIVPYPPRVSSGLGSIRPLEVGLAELVPLADAGDALSAGSVVDADLDREKAERIASQILVRATQPGDAIYAKYVPEIRSATFCLYPLYYAPYRYAGEANPKQAAGYFVMISGRTGALLAAKHPSGGRALLGKVRRLFKA